MEFRDSYSADKKSDPSEDSETADASIVLNLDIAQALNFASQQNSVPLIRSIAIRNNTGLALSDLRLEMVAKPSFARDKIWVIDRILPDETLTITDRHVELDLEYFGGLNEAEKGEVNFRLLNTQDILVDGVESTQHVRLLARDEWGGLSSMTSLIAAFVMPNDPAIARLLKDAANILASHGHNSAMDGYQSKDPKRSYMLSAAIWSAVANRQLTYAEPPTSFEKNGQKVRKPQTILDQGLATCLDTTLLFAACLEASGLNPAIMFTKGHSLVGVWLQDSHFTNTIESDSSEVRKAIAAREMITFETTGVTQIPPMMFADAVALGKNASSERDEDNFISVVDIKRARSNQIRPLASHQRSVPEQLEENEAPELASLPLPAMPDFGSFPAELVEEKPTSAAGRIDRWQRKLLDLSLRNRLLNFRDTKQTIPFLCPDVGYLEDRLADEKKIHIISLPEQNPLGDRDAQLHLEKTGKNFDAEFAVNALQRDEICCPLDSRELDARLIKLYRQAKNDMNEGGANTLYLAAGFLRWKKTSDDTKTYRAPLLLIPAKLTRLSAAGRFRLEHHEDEVRFNATLLQMLKQDFDLELPQFEGPLPLDDSGIDVPMVLETMRRAVRDIPTFEVLNETALATFSFAKYLMWKDLVDRTDSLKNNRVVRHLIDNPEVPFTQDNNATFPEASTVDVQYEPKDIVAPLPADSSQLAAIMAAAEGRDFILIGPPGTGKSQTIANMISQCLANNKTVLFVAEKSAALSVVHRRLVQNGLGEFCLELHSNKAERRNFLAQLKASWEANSTDNENEWTKVTNDLKISRNELNKFVAALHQRHKNGWSVFHALALVVKGQDRFAPKLVFDHGPNHDQIGLDLLRSIIGEIAITHRAIRPSVALEHINATNWSSRWETDFFSDIKELKHHTSALQTILNEFSAALGVSDHKNFSFKSISEFVSLAKQICNAKGKNLTIAYDKQFDLLKNSIDGVESAIIAFRTAEEDLAAEYPQVDIPRIPVDDLDRDWREASSKYWPMSVFGKSRVRKHLQSYTSSGRCEPETDLPQLRTMQLSMVELNDNELSSRLPGWAGLDTDPVAVKNLMNNAADMRDAVLRLGQLAGNLNVVAKAVGTVLNGGSRSLDLQNIAEHLQTSVINFMKSLKSYRTSATNIPGNIDSPDFLHEIVTTLGDIEAQRSQLQNWTEWCGVKEKASNHGLGQFIVDLSSGELTDDNLPEVFELAYARLWLPQVFDADPVLTKFRKFKHEETLERFRSLDDRVQSMAAGQVKRALSQNFPKPHEVARKSELGLLRHQMDLRRPSKSIRDMIDAMPKNFSKLAPCLLMSPLSIAQYLPTDQAIFDVVIFDEASQITTWDAVGSIARAKQTIIVGDPKQLPPTNFFGRNDSIDGLDDGAYFERDEESILDEAKVSGLPELKLDWHYRSRHESLIAFSNHHYYQNRLITFPSPAIKDQAVRLVEVVGGIYDRGKSRTNNAEARKIVDDACTQMIDSMRLPVEKRLSIGVVTFNAEQQELIQKYFDDARRENETLEWFFSDDRIEPTIVRNLENVQGDERDIIMFSITFGKDQAGKLSMNFGALNRDGGEKRLNVAITRAREELLVYSSMTADQIDLNRTKKIGVRHLKAFLDYANRGQIALAAEEMGSVGGFDSPFEEAVCDKLIEKGWDVRPQIGVSGFRIDLGVIHPEKPGAYLAGIECDGATYHRSASARDRDKVREQVLRNLGWEILRIWSLDWWHSPIDVANNIDNQLHDLLEVSRQEEIKKQEEQISTDEASDSEELGDGFLEGKNSLGEISDTSIIENIHLKPLN